VVFLNPRLLDDLKPGLLDVLKPRLLDGLKPRLVEGLKPRLVEVLKRQSQPPERRILKCWEVYVLTCFFDEVVAF